ncbi:hypothetical protein [Sphingobacterium sp. LRF_L2]|uniref:hypothetical protein n=1 Tax=Sphingobacterium sp. LRF_L2 TaxID=3369421 RepID=UPI003F61709D
MALVINNGFSIEQVSVAELRGIINLYKERSTEDNLSKKVGVDFGLPMAVAIQNKAVIGFAAAAVNKRGMVELSCYLLEDQPDVLLQISLRNFAEKNFHAVFGDDQGTIKKLTMATEDLLTWINKF